MYLRFYLYCHAYLELLPFERDVGLLYEVYGRPRRNLQYVCDLRTEICDGVGVLIGKIIRLYRGRQRRRSWYGCTSTVRCFYLPNSDLYHWGLRNRNSPIHHFHNGSDFQRVAAALYRRVPSTEYAKTSVTIVYFLVRDFLRRSVDLPPLFWSPGYATYIEVGLYQKRYVSWHLHWHSLNILTNLKIWIAVLSNSLSSQIKFN